MFTTISSALGLFLAIAVIVLLVRKLIIRFDENYTGTIILIVLALGLISLFCGLIACAGAVKLDLMYMLSPEEKTQIKNHNIVSLVIGYISLSLDYIIFKFIGKSYIKEQPNQESHWDLDKFK